MTSRGRPRFDGETQHGQRPRIVVAGLGNEYRRDDGAGPMAAALLVDHALVHDIGPIVDPLDLLGRWDGADLAIVIDSTASGSAPGAVQLLELPARSTGRRVTSTHGISLAGVLRLAELVGGAPGRVVVVGIEGVDFGNGRGLSEAVDAAVAVAVQKVVDLIEEVQACA